jgi:hypothetical protein
MLGILWSTWKSCMPMNDRKARLRLTCLMNKSLNQIVMNVKGNERNGLYACFILRYLMTCWQILRGKSKHRFWDSCGIAAGSGIIQSKLLTRQELYLLAFFHWRFLWIAWICWWIDMMSPRCLWPVNFLNRWSTGKTMTSQMFEARDINANACSLRCWVSETKSGGRATPVAAPS